MVHFIKSQFHWIALFVLVFAALYLRRKPQRVPREFRKTTNVTF